MKNKLVPVAFALGVVCVLLGVWLWLTKDAADKQKQADTTTISEFSNRWTETTERLGNLEQTNLSLRLDVSNREATIARVTEDLGRTNDALARTAADLEAARKSIQDAQQAAQQEIAKRDARITELENQNAALDRHAGELTNAIASLNAQINETQRKLASAEGDKAFLEKELQRLMAEKSNLEKQFNDLVVLRAQVKKLKEDLAIARRIDWIRKGLWGSMDEKGAQRLVERSGPGSTTGATNYGLNVEISADGSVKVIPPITNRPPANPPR